MPRLRCAVGKLSRTRSCCVNISCVDPSALGPSAAIVRVVEWSGVVTNILVGAVIRCLVVRRLRKLLHEGRRVQRSFTGWTLTIRAMSRRERSFSLAATHEEDNGPGNECQTDHTSDCTTGNSTCIAFMRATAARARRGRGCTSSRSMCCRAGDSTGRYCRRCGQLRCIYNQLLDKKRWYV